ncbi:MAG: hydroxymethylbilane synthase [Gammaproteobacteria bacterium]|nr:hydroxymethylbilane synthase [Gammaproteobacteria bacterium]
MPKKTLTIATRESPLALWQANYVKQLLIAKYPDLQVRLLGLTTQADDLLLNVPLYKVGGKGLFVKELEEALLSGRADIAVHSMKDVPMTLPEGLILPVILARENPLDVFVSSRYLTLNALPKNARIGTSSLRRQGQLLAQHPSLQIEFLRGNVNSRLEKCERGDFDAIILAAAGLQRLGFTHRIQSFFSAEEMLPAAGQGALGIECHSEAVAIQELIAPLRDDITAACVIAERAVCRTLNAGCHAPVAAFAEHQNGEIFLRGRVVSRDGKILLEATSRGTLAEVNELGMNVADDLLAKGAQTILDDHSELK